MLRPQLLITEDGSHTLYVPELNEHYHSSHGAIQESLHVFINAGFNYIEKDTIRILEVGFGTGLNALLTLYESIKQNKKVYYDGIEAYPIEAEIWKALNYDTILPANKDYFALLHTTSWNKHIYVDNNFCLTKLNTTLQDFTPSQKFDLIYFDAFAPTIQPDLWTLEVFEKMWNSLNAGGVLVTYSSKGSVKQNMRQAGFVVKRLEGANGKRHMIRATKT